MKQINLFGQEYKNNDEEKKYTSKIEAPIYEPKNIKPHLFSLVDKSKFLRLKAEIQNSKINEDEKNFLFMAATRHLVFNYENIADYYSHASKEMQELMEKSALVIIDFEKAIEYGYVQLCDEIRTQYLEDYGE